MARPDISGYFCRVSGYLVDVYGRSLPKFSVKFRMSPFPAMIDTIGIVSQEGMGGSEGFFVTDDDGYIEVDLVRKASYRVSFQRITPVYDITVPDASTADLLGLLNPILKTLEITCTPDVEELNVGESVQLAIHGNISDGREVDYSSYAVWSQNTDAYSSLTTEGLLTATAPGTVEVSLTLASLTIIKNKNISKPTSALFWSPVVIPDPDPLEFEIQSP